MKANNSDAIRMMVTIWRKSPGDYFCVSTKTKVGKWRDHFFKRAQLNKAVDFVEANLDKNLYMCPHGFTKPRRHKDFAVDPALLYADLDECDPKSIDIRPTIAIESSPGRYVAYWYADGPVTEELNRRLTYHVGSDVSGWDRTQVLRIPGTHNLKYDDKPTVRILWSDGPRYETKRLEKLVPEVKDDKGRTVDQDASDIYKRYEKILPIWARREFINPKVQQGKRSEVLWKLINACLEAGMTHEECFIICWHSPWNKHADRRDGEKQLEREIGKATGQHVGGGTTRKMVENKKKNKPLMEQGQDDPTKKSYTFTTMAEVEEEEVDWIVWGAIARQQTTIVEGDPGVGKSYMLMWVMAHLCNGVPLPFEDPHLKRKPLKVLYCDMENSAGAVTKHRLKDNGLKNWDNYVQFTDLFSVDDQESIEAFERDVLKKFRPDVVVIDPVNLYIGSADTYRASETQQALQVLKRMSEDYNFALIIVRHLNKGGGTKALYAGNGSIAFAGVARIILAVGWHPEEPDMRVVACTKNNLSRFMGSWGYTIESLPDTISRKDRSKLTYEGRVDYSSDEIIGTTNQKDEGSVAIAADLIREMMGAENEVNYHSLLKNAEGRSISETSIRKAAASMDLKKVTRGRGVKRLTFLVKK
jgi:DNA repair protein RadA/Sms